MGRYGELPGVDSGYAASSTGPNGEPVVVVNGVRGYYTYRNTSESGATYSNFRTFVPLGANSVAATSTGGSGGAGGGGGGGGGYSAAGSTVGATVRGWFQEYYGSVPNAVATRAENENWTEQDVINYAVANGGNGSGLTIIRDNVRRIAAPYYAGDPSGCPSSLVDSLIKQGYWDDTDYLTNTYFPTLKGVGGTNPLASGFVDSWTKMTGRPLTYTAQQQLQKIVTTYGYTDIGLAAWEAWVKTTESAYTGNYGADTRATITNIFNAVLGRNPTAEELAQNSPYWTMAVSGGENAIAEAIMQSPEGKALFADKPAATSASDWVASLQAKDAVMRWYYGDHVVQGEDGSLTVYSGEPDLVQPDTSTTGVPDIPAYQAPATWKALSNAQFAEDLNLVGITVKDGKYFKDGKEVAYDDLLTYLPADTYYKDAQGYHYIQDEGAIDPRTGVATAGPTRPKASATTGASQNPFTNLGLTYMTPELAKALKGVSAEELQKQFTWTEEAEYMAGVYDSVLMESYGSTFSSDDWYKVASGAKGSGAMRAKLVNAQNRVAFREVWRGYFGTDPDPGDYDYVTQNFVSPTEFAHRMAAKESAKAKIDSVNELLSRTLDHQVTLADLENLAMGGKDSGVLQAMIDQATRLDAYTDELYQYLGRTPSANDYAQVVAKYPSVSAFKWDITVQETMAEMGDDIKETWNKVYPDNPLTDQQLRIMIGKSEGWGEIQKQYNEAEETAAEQETARKTAMNIDKIAPIYNIAEQGGFKQGLPGLGDLGA